MKEEDEEEKNHSFYLLLFLLLLLGQHDSRIHQVENKKSIFYSLSTRKDNAFIDHRTRQALNVVLR